MNEVMDMTINYWKNKEYAKKVHSDGGLFISYTQKEICDVSKLLENTVNRSTRNKYEKHVINTYTNVIEQYKKSINDKISEIVLANNTVWYNTDREKDLKDLGFDYA